MRVIVIVFVAGALCACREARVERGAETGGGRGEQDVPGSVGPDPWQAARARGIEFRALGQEPGWYLEIDDGESMRLVYDYGEREATTAVPEPVVDGTTTTYDSRSGEHHLRVVIQDEPCSDVMSGLRFSHTVTVTIDGSTYRGCGQDLASLPPPG